LLEVAATTVRQQILKNRLNPRPVAVFNLPKTQQQSQPSALRRKTAPGETSGDIERRYLWCIGKFGGGNALSRHARRLGMQNYFRRKIG
jgi:hypothetical protein